MISSNLQTFFTTIAQVTFTAAGLVIVAVASDTLTRKFWFGSNENQLAAIQVLLFLFLPGFVSIVALIPPYLNEYTPVWPLSFVGSGIVYLAIPIALFIKKRKQNLKGKRDSLDKELDLNFFRLFFPLAYIIYGIIGFVLLSNRFINPGLEGILGMIVCFNLIYSVISIPTLFSKNIEEPKLQFDTLLAEPNHQIVEKIELKKGSLRASSWGLFLSSILFLTFLIRIRNSK